jgi:enoyl-[acyl-carrier protein] reductase I
MATTQRAVGDLDLRLVELDVTSDEDLDTLADRLEVVHLDGVVHGIAGAAQSALGAAISEADLAAAMATIEVSAISLARLTHAVQPLLEAAPGRDASVVALTFAPDRVWPGYGWMGVAKATLDAVVRNLAVELGPVGIRVNAVDAGPLRTPSARAIPGATTAFEHWGERAPLGWDGDDPTPVADVVLAALSPLLRGTTGTRLIVDGGAHVVGG